MMEILLTVLVQVAGHSFNCFLQPFRTGWWCSVRRRDVEVDRVLDLVWHWMLASVDRPGHRIIGSATSRHDQGSCIGEVAQQRCVPTVQVGLGNQGGVANLIESCEVTFPKVSDSHGHPAEDP